jgi:hypothetical protein
MSKWKQKERELTPEEAIEKALADLKPFWYGSAPRLAAISTPKGVHAFPLDDKFSKEIWIVMFLDPTSITRKEAFLYAKEFHRRYSGSNVQILLVLSCPYNYLKEREPVETFIQRNGLQFVVAIDTDGAIKKAFGVSETPHVMLLDRGQKRFEGSGVRWCQDFEAPFQKFMWEQELGLPLEPVFSPNFVPMKDLKVLELGTKGGSKDLKDEGISLQGEWKREEECIFSEADVAQVTFPAGVTDVSVVMQTRSRERAAARVVVEVEGVVLRPENFGSDLKADEAGVIHTQVRVPRMYHLLTKLSGERTVVLKFRELRKVGIAINSVVLSIPRDKDAREREEALKREQEAKKSEEDLAFPN